MQHIPGPLISALVDLGLSGYEARIYAALVLLDGAEAKELVELLGISKPSVYEGLDTLAGAGLAVKRNSKPALYSPVEPEMALKILTERHADSARIALIELKRLEQEKVHRDHSEAVWTVYGDANISFKIRSMFQSAHESIECTMAERYLPLLEEAGKKNISLKLTILSDDRGLYRMLKKRFPNKDHVIHVLPIAMVRERIPPLGSGMEDISNFIHFENVLELIVDDKELLSIPPIFANHITGMNTRNRAMILHTRATREALWGRMMKEESLRGPAGSAGTATGNAKQASSRTSSRTRSRRKPSRRG